MKNIIISPAFINVEAGDYFESNGEVYKVLNVNYKDEQGRGIVIKKVGTEELYRLEGIRIKTEEEIARNSTDLLKTVS
ncbi:hypothetical protein IM538_22175 [Cytobacillus suaedae]|nr:hypothetical protein IM538_22175 [Cytobacillus suaedae]